MNPTTDPPTADLPLGRFDQIAVTQLRQAVEGVIGKIPEVRSIALVVDYHGELNKTGVEFLVWAGESGAVLQVSELFGSLNQMTQAVAFGTERLHVLHEQLRQRITILLAEGMRNVSPEAAAQPTSAENDRRGHGPAAAGEDGGQGQSPLSQEPPQPADD